MASGGSDQRFNNAVIIQANRSLAAASRSMSVAVTVGNSTSRARISNSARCGSIRY